MAGSRGTLGVLTQVSLKVMPKAEAVATLRVPGGGIAAMTRAMSSPFDVNGAAEVAGDVYLRLEGFEKSVAYRAEQLLGIVGGELFDGHVWKDIRDVAALKEAECVWRICMRPSDYEQASIGHEAVLDWAGGCAWIGAEVEGAVDVHHQLQSLVAGKGHATLIKGPAALRNAVPVFQPEAAPVAALSAGLRAKFDPCGILNPGLMA